jgi:hypothetical protein
MLACSLMDSWRSETNRSYRCYSAARTSEDARAYIVLLRDLENYFSKVFSFG